MKPKIWRVFSFIPVILWMILIAGNSSATGQQSASLSEKVAVQLIHMADAMPFVSIDESQQVQWVQKLQTPVRKCAHMVEYAVLAILWMIPLSLYGWRGKRLVITAVLFCALYAASDELHQRYVKERDGNLIDVGIDTVGAGIGALLFMLICFRHRDGESE